MIERLERVDPNASADEITEEYVEVTVAEALDSLRSPGAGEFFGRIDEPRRTAADRTVVHRATPHRGRPARPGRRRLAGADLGAVLPRHRGRPARRRVPPPVHARRRRDDRLPRRAPRRPRRRDVAAGIPDPVLAEIGAARRGDARDRRDDPGRAGRRDPRPDRSGLIVQGGPGTGKTAVALHRAAYLLFEHRRRLPAMACWWSGPTGRSSTTSPTCCPRSASAASGSARRSTCASRRSRSRAPTTATHVEGRGRPLDELEPRRWTRSGRRTTTSRFRSEPARRCSTRADRGLARRPPSRESCRSTNVASGCACSPSRSSCRRTDGDEAWSQAAPLKAASTRWPTQQPVRLVDRLLPGPTGSVGVWTAADQFLVDEANTLLNGTPFTYGHVVVDEAQDHSAVALRVIGRRCPSAR